MSRTPYEQNFDPIAVAVAIISIAVLVMVML